MLSYALAIAVALSSLVLFLTAFVMSDIHRKDDFLWSGVGLLYALILWFCARNITGTVLLGQAAASILLVSFCWQTLKLRKAIANPEKASEISNFSVLQATIGLLNRQKSKKSQPQVTTTPPKTEIIEKIEESEIAIPDTTSQEKTSTTKTEVKEEIKRESKIDNPTLETPKETTESKVKPLADVVVQKQPDLVVENKETKIVVEDKPQESVAIDNKIPEIPQQPETIAEVKPEIIETENKPQESVAIDNKIPETPQQPETITEAKPEITETENKSSTPIATTPESKPENNQDSTKNILPETPELKIEPPVVETPPKIESKIEDTSVTNNPETPAEKTENPPSPLDSLETVEVAEVLEADPENISRNKTSDRNNIIEVKTTEIESNIQNLDSEEQ